MVFVLSLGRITALPGLPYLPYFPDLPLLNQHF